MQTDEPLTKAESKNRTPAWRFQTLGTFAARLVRRAAKLVTPQGRLTLALNANEDVQRELQQRLAKLAPVTKLAA